MTVQGSQLRVAYKNPCRIASTAILGLTGLAAFEGVTPVAGDRVLAKDQTSQPARGIYVAASGAWARADDMDSSSSTQGDQITAGLAVYIQEGTANAKKTWVLTTTGTIDLDTTSLTFEEGPTVGGGGGGTTAVTQTQAVFVSKAGNDSDTGLTKDDPKLSIGSAITAATALTPTVSNRVTINVQDAGAYTEVLSLPAFVTLNAPEATVSGRFTAVGDEGRIKLFRLVGTTLDLITVSGVGERWLEVAEMEATSGIAVAVGAGGTANLNIGTITKTVVGGVGVTCSNGLIRGSIEEIAVVGATVALIATSVGVLRHLTVGRIDDDGTGTGVSITGNTTHTITVGTIDCNTTYTVTGASGVLNMFVNDLIGSVGTITGTANVTEAGTGPTGDVVGPGASLDNAIPRFDLTTGKILQAGAASNNVFLNDSGDLYPQVTDGGALGQGTLAWSDLFLANGGVLNFNNGQATLGHFLGSIRSNVPLIVVGDITPSANATYDLGTTSLRWKELHMSSAGVINFNAGDITLTHTLNTLTFAGGTSGYNFNDGDTFVQSPTLATDGTSLRAINVEYYANRAVWDRRLLHANQLQVISNSARIASGTVFWVVANPTSGNSLVLTDGTTTRTYGFGSGGDVTVTIDGSFATTMENLATAITGDGTGKWSAVKVGSRNELAATGGLVVIYRDDGANASDRMYGTITTGTPKYINFQGATIWDYRLVGDGAAAATLPSSDPASKEFGFGVTSGALISGCSYITVLDQGLYMLDEGPTPDIWVQLNATGGASIGGSTGATDNAVLRADGTGGATLQASDVILDDSENYTGVASVGMSQRSTAPTVAAGNGAIWVRDDLVPAPIHTDGDNDFDYHLLHYNIWKRPVDLATTGNITLSAEQTIDGTLTSASRVLVREQDTGSENGVYTTAAGAWVRTDDMDDGTKDHLDAGLSFICKGGSTYAGRLFTLVVAAPITVGSTTMSFALLMLVTDGLGTTNEALVRTDGTGGSKLRGSSVTLDASGNLEGVGYMTMAEQASPASPGAGVGRFFVRNDVPTVPAFQDDTSPNANEYNLLSWSPVKRPCVVATTGSVNLAAANSPSAVDGVTTSVGSRILVWQQTVASTNGIYEVTTQGGGDTSTWARTADFDNAVKDHVEAGVGTYIQTGDLWARTSFTFVTTGAFVIGVSSQEWIPEGGLARSDASSTAIIASTAFTNGTFVVDDSGFTNMRDHSEVAIFFMPLTLGSNTIVDLVVFWSDDGTTVPFALDDNIQQSDYDIVNQADGSYNPKPYTARLTTAGSELVAGKGFHLVVPKGGGACKIGVKGNDASGTFTVRTQRLVN